MKIAILALLLAACGVSDPEQPVAWVHGVRPVAADGSSPEWAARVDVARDEWIALLGDCAAFDGSAGVQPVELVTQDAMTADTGTLDIGCTTHERILVAGTADDLAHYPTYGHRTLMHEMGHALGLAHVAPATDPSSVMHPIDDNAGDPDDADIAAARAALGCAP